MIIYVSETAERNFCRFFKHFAIIKLLIGYVKRTMHEYINM